MNEINTKPKLSWRLPELSEATGLSVKLLRKEIAAKRLKSRKVGGARIVLAKDVMEFLESWDVIAAAQAEKQKAPELSGAA